jgi:glycosyltransferase involved in cell wall biosynthesis
MHVASRSIAAPPDTMRLSIVTPTIDSSAAYIDEAIRSIAPPPGIEIEHLIVHDGGPALTRRLVIDYPHLRILRGPASGPTPAIAMGIAAASGDFIFCLSSDDRLCDQAIEALQRASRARPDVEIWTGGTRIFRTAKGGREVTVRTLQSPAVTAATLDNLMDDLPLLTARFIHRSVYARIGNMDQRFPESSDREFMIRAAVRGVREAPLGVIASELREHAGSHTMHRRPGVVPPYLPEHLRIADLWLAQADTPHDVARLFRRWRAREVLRLVYYQLGAKQFRQARQSISAALAVDPLSGLRATTAIPAWFRRRRS